MKLASRPFRGLIGFGLLTLTALIIACSEIPQYPHSEPAVSPQQSFAYQRDIKPILENRCMACHGCYDAPCQLKLTSADGVKRGASQQQVYNAMRLEDMPPTRLGTDAQSEAQWREQGFFSVLHDADQGAAAGLDGSLLFRMLELGQRNPLPANSRLPDEIKIGTAHSFSCPTLDTFADYAQANPHGGMPYATTGLSADEFARLSQWIAEGAVTEPMPWQPSAAETASIERWENFFNQTGRREQLVARYLFEHLFVAHIHFPTINGSSFYELVRSSTPPGEPVWIRAVADATDLHIHVEDQGPGITGNAEDLCTRGRRGDRGQTGLGLAIVASVMARSGGQLALENRAGAGLRATLSWPLTGSA